MTKSKLGCNAAKNTSKEDAMGFVYARLILPNAISSTKALEFSVSDLVSIAFITKVPDNRILSNINNI